MKQDAYTPFIIFGAQTSEETGAKERNEMQSKLLKLDIPYRIVRESYKGVEADLLRQTVLHS